MKKILSLCLAIVASLAVSGWSATPNAVDMVVIDSESSVYVLYDDGFIQTTGFAVSFGYPGSVDAVSLTMTNSKSGYYVMESDGTIHSFGDAVIIPKPITGDEPYVDMELYQYTNSPYFLRQDGSVVVSGEAVFYGELLRSKDAVDLELTSDGLGYYVLYEDGQIAFFGTAIDRGYTISSSIKAVDLELDSDGYYVCLEDGGILSFGTALSMPFRTRPSEDVVNMTMTKQGYRILTESGEVENFIRVDAQGVSNWYAQVSARTVNPQATNTPTPTQTPKADVNYFTYEESGFAEKIIGKIPATASLPTSMNSGFASLYGGGLFAAVADGEEEPVRTILLYSVVESTGVDSTGAVFAQLSPERGDAIIRGISYSSVGLYVVVEDVNGLLIFLIEGNFESSDINAFSLY